MNTNALLHKLNIALERVLKRPLCIPAIIISAVILVVYYANPTAFIHSKTYYDRYNTTFSGVVINKKASINGDTDYVIDTEEYGRLSFKDKDSVCSIELGGSYLIDGVITSPSKPTNPGEFDYEDYLRRKGISYSLIRVDSCIKVANPSVLSRLADKYQKVNAYVRLKILDSISSEESRALNAAIFMGDKSLIDDATRYYFSHSGCSHILAVSGAHISGFLMIVPFIFKSLKLNKNKSGIFYLLFCIVIGSFTGWSESVSRAVVMSCCCFYARDYLSGMSLAALLMISVNPLCVLSSAYQMSFCASLSIYLLMPSVTKIIARYIRHKSVQELLSSYISVQLGMIPFFMVGNTHIGPIMFIIQLLNNQLAGLACVLFMPCVLLSFIPVIGSILSMPVNIIVNLISWLSRVASLMMSKSININAMPHIIVFLFITLIILILTNNNFVTRKLKLIIGVLLALSIGSSLVGYVYRAEATIVFIDVGQGDCCLIITDNATCLIDSGVPQVSLNKVIAVLDYYGVDKIDYAIATHYDLDHSGGFGNLYRLGRIDELYAPCITLDEESINYFMNVYEKNSEEECIRFVRDNVKQLSSGDVIKLSEKVSIDVLSPMNAIVDSNSNSLVMMLNTSQTHILFTGDVDSVVEETLTQQYGTNLSADIIKIAHHGSKYSSSEQFIQYINPSIAVISVGKNNYGHPSSEVIERLIDNDSIVYRTDKSGAVIVRIRGSDIKVTEFL